MLAGDAHHDAVYSRLPVGDERNRPRVVVDLDAEVRDARGQRVDEQPAAHLAHDFGQVAAGAGLGVLVEGVRDLAAGPDQTVTGPRRLHLARQVRCSVRDSLIDEPRVVVECVVGVEACACLVGVGTAGHHHVAIEVLGVVLEAIGALSGRAAVAAEVDVATGHGARAAVAGRDLQERHLRSLRGRPDGGRSARSAEADHDHIGFEIEALDIGQPAGPARGEAGGIRFAGHGEALVDGFHPIVHSPAGVTPRIIAPWCGRTAASGIQSPRSGAHAEPLM